MHAKLFFDGVTGGALSYANMFDDIIDVICGETNFANLSVATQDTEGHIVSTVAAGWTLVSRDDTSYPGYIYYILSAPVAGATTKLKYMLYRCDTSNGQFYWSYGDALNGSSTTTLLHTKSSDIATHISNQAALNTIINSQAYYVYLSVSPRNIGIMVGYSSYGTSFSAEITWQQSAFLRTISQDEDFCPMVHYDSTGSRSDNQPLPHPWTDDPDAYMEVTSSGGVNSTSDSNIDFVLGGGRSWFDDLGDAQVAQDDLSTPYVFHKPWAKCGNVIVGKMHADVPWYRLDNTNAPSTAQGDEVTITPIGGGPARTFIVWATEWGSSTGSPLYVEKI